MARALLAGALALVVTTWAATVRSAPLDFNGDGTSDYVEVQIDEGGALSWHLLVEGTSSSLGLLGEVGDHLIPARWVSPGGAPGIGVITVDGTEVLWRVSGSGTPLRFGSPQDLFLAGGDFDGSGLADAVIRSRQGRKMRWRVKPDPFGGTSTSERSFAFGTPRSIAFYMNPAGSGDEAAIIQSRRVRGEVRPIVRTRSLAGAVRSFATLTGFPAAAGRPWPVAQGDGRDALAFISAGTSQSTVECIGRRGVRLSRGTVAGAGTVLVGDYHTSPGEELAIQSGGGSFSLYSCTAGDLGSITFGEGIPVDEVNINTFADSAPEGCAPAQPNDGGGGFVWKPNSDTQYFAVAVLPPSYSGKLSRVETITTAGEVIKGLTTKGVGNGGRTAWQDYSLTGRDYKRQYGSIGVRATLDDGSCVIWEISDPSRRVD